MMILMTEIKRGPTDYMVDAVNAYIRENAEQRAEIERLRAALQEIADNAAGAEASIYARQVLRHEITPRRGLK